MTVLITDELKKRLRERGVECFYAPGHVILPADCSFEPPCSIKWMDVSHSLRLGSYSYAVTGFFQAVKIGRYVSVGQQVQIGVGDHPTQWLSSSPAFYLQEKLFDIGRDFPSATVFHGFKPKLNTSVPLPGIKSVEIGNDVWIGNDAFVRPGVTIGDGAVVGACSVVTRDVPPYAIVAGNPAIIRRYRFSEELIQRLLQSRWWTLAPWQLTGIDLSAPASAIDAIERRVAESPPFAPGFFHLADLVSDSQERRNSAVHG
jgi:acetyltransferase-like isoleucine patch superfamily enzyme